jgi:transposase-like protein
MGRLYQKLEELSSKKLGLSLDELRGQTLDDFARKGAKIILEVALAEEVAEFLGRERYERGEGNCGGYRNGKRARRLQTGSGAVKVSVPKITGASLPFQSEVLPAWERRSKKLDEIVPLLYAEGLSTRDFERALGQLWGETGLSRSCVSRANKRLHAEFSAWRRRDLSGEEVLYLFFDAVYLKVRIGDCPAEAVLVAHGITAKGERTLVGLILGTVESEDSWKDLVTNLTGRGLKPPALVVHDGNAGLAKALKGAWTEVPRQRCVAHKIRNVLNRVPKKHQAEVKRELTKIFYASGIDAALKAVSAFASKFGTSFPSACGVLRRDLEDCLTFYRFPEAHWKRLRTSNVIERAFREVRRRTDVVGRFPNEMSALTLIWAAMEQDRLVWRGVQMDDALRAAVAKSKGEAIHVKVDLKALDPYLEAA